MNKKEAISIIQKQITKLEKFDKPENFSFEWQVQTCAYIDKIFGEKSLQAQRISKAPSGSKYSPDLTSFLLDCIETIKDIGLYKKPKSNFLVTMPDWAATLLLTGIFIIGIAIGELGVVSNTFNKTDSIEVFAPETLNTTDSISQQKITLN